MNVSEMVQQLNLKVFTNASKLGTEITGGYVSDLLSDVMGNATQGEVWITLQTHKNTVAIASLKELAAIILVKGFEPSPEALEHAINEGIPILGTTDYTFAIAGKLYALLKK